MRKVEIRDLGRLGYAEAYALQKQLVGERQRGEIGDRLLLLEHPRVITMGRNGSEQNLRASREELERLGIEFHETDRGGDVTYHGPGQLIAYPILDLREWKCDVRAYVNALEQAVIEVLGEFGIKAGREPGMRGVWVNGAKIAAIGVHISRWITSHGLALNVNPELEYFRYIVPCGLKKPVTSMRREGSQASLSEVSETLARRFGAVFEREPAAAELEKVE